MSAILSRGISLLLIPIYTRVFAPSDYGVLDFLAVFGIFLGVFATLEITQAIARYLPDYKGDKTAQKIYSSTSLWYTVGIYSALTALFWGFAGQISDIFFSSDTYSPLIKAAAISYAVLALVQLVQNQLKWELRPVASAMISIVLALSVFIVTSIFIFSTPLGTLSVFLGQAIGGAIALAFGMFLARASYGFSFDISALKQLLVFSAPLALSSLSAISALYVDRLLVKEMLGLSDLGQYSVAARISIIVSLGLIGAQGAMMPLISHNHKDPLTKLALEKILRLFVFFSAVLYLAIVLFLPYIFHIVVGDDYLSSMTLVPFLMLSALFGGMYIFAPGLWVERKTKQIAVINLIGLAINVALNILLITHLGLMGAAIATCVSAFSIFAITMLISQRLYYIRHNWKKLYFGMVVVIAISLGALFMPYDNLGWGLIRGASLCASILLLMAQGLITKEEIVAIVKGLHGLIFKRTSSST
jgi:O-antigen/teichoic acid export membrane protein